MFRFDRGAARRYPDGALSSAVDRLLGVGNRDAMDIVGADAASHTQPHIELLRLLGEL